MEKEGDGREGEERNERNETDDKQSVALTRGRRREKSETNRSDLRDWPLFSL